MTKDEFFEDCEAYAKPIYCEIDYGAASAAYDFMCEKWPDKAQEKHVGDKMLMLLDTLFFILD